MWRNAFTIPSMQRGRPAGTQSQPRERVGMLSEEKSYQKSSRKRAISPTLPSTLFCLEGRARVTQFWLPLLHAPRCIPGFVSAPGHLPHQSRHSPRGTCLHALRSLFRCRPSPQRGQGRETFLPFSFSFKKVKKKDGTQKGQRSCRSSNRKERKS